MKVLYSAISCIVLQAFLISCERNKYSGTAEQGGFTYIVSQGITIYTALKMYESDYGRLPHSLSDLVEKGILLREDINYPRIYDLPDRRDIRKMPNFTTWFYMPDNMEQPDKVVLISPLPIFSTMGRKFESPKRILIKQDGSTETVEEADVVQFIHESIKPNVMRADDVLK